MRLVRKAFSLCKDGNREEENEDAVFPQMVNGSSLTVDNFCCAMADGATQSSFSKLWASLLVNESCLSQENPLNLQQTIFSARSKWKNALPDQNLPWPVAIKIKQGSFATLLWFKIWQKNGFSTNGSDSDAQGWTACSVGDTCMFQIAKGKFINSFPLTKADQFNNSPDLVSTNPVYGGSRLVCSKVSGQWNRGDHFLIASDALAQWIINGMERSDLTWPIISMNLTSLMRFQTWIKALRRQSAIKNDDTSLICLTVDG